MSRGLLAKVRRLEASRPTRLWMLADGQWRSMALTGAAGAEWEPSGPPQPGAPWFALLPGDLAL